MKKQAEYISVLGDLDSVQIGHRVKLLLSNGQTVNISKIIGIGNDFGYIETKNTIYIKKSTNMAYQETSVLTADMMGSGLVQDYNLQQSNGGFDDISAPDYQQNQYTPQQPIQQPVQSQPISNPEKDKILQEIANQNQLQDEAAQQSGSFEQIKQRAIDNVNLQQPQPTQPQYQQPVQQPTVQPVQQPMYQQPITQSTPIPQPVVQSQPYYGQQDNNSQRDLNNQDITNIKASNSVHEGRIQRAKNLKIVGDVQN